MSTPVEPTIHQMMRFPLLQPGPCADYEGSQYRHLNIRNRHLVDYWGSVQGTPIHTTSSQYIHRASRHHVHHFHSWSLRATAVLSQFDAFSRMGKQWDAALSGRDRVCYEDATRASTATAPPAIRSCQALFQCTSCDSTSLCAVVMAIQTIAGFESPTSIAFATLSFLAKIPPFSYAASTGSTVYCSRFAFMSITKYLGYSLHYANMTNRVAHILLLEVRRTRSLKTLPQLQPLYSVLS